MATTQPKIFKILFGAIAITGIVLVMWQMMSSSEKEAPSSAASVNQTRRQIVDELQLLGLVKSPLFDPKGGTHFGHAPSMTSEELMLLVRRIMRDHNLVLTSAVNYEDRNQLYVEISTPQQQLVARLTFMPIIEGPALAEGVRGKIAIIIDDFGYLRNQATAGFMDLDGDVTHSIIPGRRYSQVLADESKTAGKEVIIHMPLEPENYNGRDEAEFILLYGMDRLEVRSRVRKAFQSLPEALGINNHEGSLASLDTVLLDVMADELLDRGKFYVDSYTTSKTRGLATMRRRGVPSLGRQVFIDNEDDPAYIRNQLAELAALAERRGSAVGIGHVGASHIYTLEVLREEIPKLQQQGFEFVFVSELMTDSEF